METATSAPPVETATSAPPVAMDTSASVPPPSPRAWKAPKAPLTRQQADEMGRAALKAVSTIAHLLIRLGRGAARIVGQGWRVIEAVPAALQLFFVLGIGLLLGIAGAIALQSSLGLICTVVVIPVSSIALGVLGQRWYTGLGGQSARQIDSQTSAPTTSDLQRSVEYVDRKLTLALTSIGTERHQQALIALFQAKTAVELTLGTEQDSAINLDLPLAADDHALRPRIRMGAKSQLREGSSLVAS
ncbi:hypothetical protein AWB99_08425 [Mycolicibacterium confluentis]|nr:hypothetical protein [Mycolicibacterium confluentis]ORV33035.1 hypothetical protein AWB99_08425 [Mycolicibacterium confluentis]